MNDEASCYCIQQYLTYILSDSVTKSLVEFSRCEDCLIKCRCNRQSTDATPTEVTFNNGRSVQQWKKDRA